MLYNEAGLVRVAALTVVRCLAGGKATRLPPPYALPQKPTAARANLRMVAATGCGAVS